jgi:hypothetical protein
MKRKYLKAIVLVAFFLVCANSFAQGPPLPPPPSPIDGGILGLFGVAIFYAVKKIRESKK